MPETDSWEPARQRALAQLEKQTDAELAQFRASPGYSDESEVDVERLFGILDSRRHQKAAILSPDWVPPRPDRRMPSLWTIARYWEKQGTFDVLITRPLCFGCIAGIPHAEDATPAARWNGASRYLDRAHLADRWLGGLDGPQNLVPLCRLCHSVMPMFEDGREAIEWVLRGGMRNAPELQDALAEFGLLGRWYTPDDLRGLYAEELAQLHPAAKPVQEALF